MTEALPIDSIQLENLREEYDYDSQIVKPGQSYIDLLQEAVRNIMRAIFGNDTYRENETLIWSVIAVVLFLGLVLLIIKKKPKIFYGKGKEKKKMDYSISEDNIYGIDFDKEITKALDGGNFREAVRFAYLKTLRLLSDSKLIDWRPFKTPSQYSREFRDEQFSEMTGLFLRVRYGGFDADRELFDCMHRLAAGIKAKVDNDTKDADK